MPPDITAVIAQMEILAGPGEVVAALLQLGSGS